ncbi:MAG TPA: LuxR family transcriptional regulator [Methylocystis sp.]|nr:LuxR family transcriptional regulator [Methylocystis sp.]
MLQRRLHDILNEIVASEKIERAGEEVLDPLKEARSEYGLEHVAYGALNIPTRRALPLIAATYSQEWQQHYLRSGYATIDPVVRAGLANLTPVDWADIREADPSTQKFFDEATEFDIGRNGFSVPVRGWRGEFALFSASTSMNKAQWDKEKLTLGKNLMMVAYCLHDRVMKLEGVYRMDGVPTLTLRERDCLCWRACGKSDWDISQILGLSERTVGHYLRNARLKLAAVNTTHAVSRALFLGLIVLP